MRVWEFAESMRYMCLKNTVIIKRGDECIRKYRVEDLPWRDDPNRHPRLSWVDEHIDKVCMEAIRNPHALTPDYVITITLELATE